jgi:hypothetical protein
MRPGETLSVAEFWRLSNLLTKMIYGVYLKGACDKWNIISIFFINTVS